jgi:hypothetical protein
MTVKTLIEELKKFPENKEINIHGEEVTLTSNIQVIEFDNGKLAIVEKV